MRTTLTPASSRAAICAAVPVAGPSVATILVRRITRYEPRLVVIKLTNSGVDDGFVEKWTGDTADTNVPERWVRCHPSGAT